MVRCWTESSSVLSLCVESIVTLGGLIEAIGGTCRAKRTVMMISFSSFSAQIEH